MAAGKKKEEDINKIPGVAGFVHNVIMFITYPVRKPLRCLAVLAFLGALVYFLPIYMYNVPQEEVYDWYMGHFKDVKEQIIVPYIQKGTDILVDNRQQPTRESIGRKTFSTSGSSSHRVDILSEEASDVVDIRDIRRAEEDVEAPRLQLNAPNYNDYEEEIENLVSPATVSSEPEESIVEKPVDYSKLKGEYQGLDYLDKVVTIEGTAEVHNVNELSVEGIYMFLYGIYSAPRTQNGVRGREFLKNLVKDEKVRCDILAYTQEGKIATSECYIGKVNINKAMVLQGYSKRAPR